jgi:hypothetical protein
MKVKIEFVVFWAVAVCDVVNGYQRYGINPKDGGNMVLQNVGIQPPHYMVQQVRGPQLLKKR